MLAARRKSATRSQDGFTLVEVMLGVAGVMALAAVGFYLYQDTQSNTHVRIEQDNVRTITSNAKKIYGSTGSYAQATTAQAIADEVPPRSMVNGTGLLAQWGQPVLIAPVAIDGKPNAGLQLTYSAVPSRACSKFASSVADGMWDIEVGGRSVLATEGSRVIRGRVDAARVSQACASGAPVVLTYHSLQSGLVSAVQPPVELLTPPPMSLPPPPLGVPPSAPPMAPPGSPPPPPIATPPGLPPTATPPAPPPVTSVPPPSSPPPSSPPPPTSPPPPGSPVCVVPSPSTRTCGSACTDGSDGHETRTTNNNFSCPAGQLITTPGPYLHQASGQQQRDEERYRTESASCPDPFGAPVWNAAGWQAWTSTSAWTPTYSCAAQCTAPASTTAAITRPVANETRTIGCLAGQYGSTAQSRTRVENGTRTTNYSCPSPVGAPTSSTSDSWSGTYTATGSWSTTSSTCAACPADSTQPQTQWVAASGSCPSEQSGSRTWEKQQSRSRSVSYSCPSGTTSLPPATYGSWSAWSDTGSTRNLVDTCSPTTAPPAPPPPPPPAPPPPPPAWSGSNDLSCSKSFRTKDSPTARRVRGYFSVGDTSASTRPNRVFANPSDWTISWAGLPVGGSRNIPAKPYTNPAPNALEVTADCSSNAEWGYRATVTYKPTGAVSTADFTCRCINLGL